MVSKDRELHSNLSLRQIDPVNDVDDFMVWACDEHVSQFCTWYPCTSKEQTIEYINDKVINHPYFKLICLNNRAIGYVLVTFNEGNDKCRAEIGYVLAARYWGRGIATWAVDMLVSMIFEERLELERVEAFVDVENIASHKVLEKVGFLREGVLRKHYIMKGRARDFVIFSLLRVDKYDGVGTNIQD
ncbi:hypothetical protein vseg_007757 [Gypsophila vaccaria]